MGIGKGVWTSVLLSGLLIGCALPEGGDRHEPESVHYQWLQARAAGDTDTLWELLDPSAQEDFQAWWRAETFATRKVRAAYTEEEAAATLKSLGDAAQEGAADGKALFAHFVQPEPKALGLVGRLSARVRTVPEERDGAEILLETWGGDQVRLIQTAAGWAVPLTSVEAKRLEGLKKRAEENLSRVEKKIAQEDSL